MKDAGGDRGNPGEAARHAALTVVLAGAAAPGDDGSVALQGQALIVAGGDCGPAGEAARHAALPEVVAVVATPNHDGAVALQGQAVKVAGGDRCHAREAARHAALADVDGAAAPGDDGAVAFQGQAVYVAATIAVTPERPLGALHCPQSRPPPQPQATTVPLPFKARL